MNTAISVILKVCNTCNLKCKHCYELADSFSGIDDIMPLPQLERIFSLIQREYHYINYVWFGGEPLLCGLKYFERAIHLQKIHNKGNVITNHIQTNGTLLTPQFACFFKAEGFLVSISYDAQYNNQLRDQTELTLQGIKNCKQEGLSCGVLSTIHSGNFDKQIEMYQHIKAMHCPMKFNPVFPSGAARNNTAYLLNIESYVSETVNFFQFWCSDQTAAPVSPFIQYIRMFLGLPGRNCTYGTCLYKWISVEPDGSILPCVRFSSDYIIDKVQNISSIESLFNAPSYKKIVEQAIQRRLLCRTECQLYPLCNGGCNSAAATECGLTKHDFQLCAITKSIFPKISDQIEALKAQSDVKNPIVRNLLQNVVL